MPKRKRRSCPLCKPHKTGGAPRDTDRMRMEARLAAAEAQLVREARNVIERVRRAAIER